MKARHCLLPLCALLPVSHALDEDGDGISDVYAAHHGVPVGSGAEDPDGDGQKNHIESAWGTDPFDNASAFRPVSAQVAAGLFDFAIPTTVGKRYQFQGSSDLLPAWTDVDLPFTGTGATEHLLTALPIAGTDKFFWRVQYKGEADADGDGLGAFEELLLGTSDTSADSDGDQVGDLDEFLLGLDPASNLDADGDGLPDDWEAFHGAYAAGADNDGDGWTNLEEYSGGDDPNEIDGTLAPPTLQVRGDYSQSGASYTVLDGGELSLRLRSAAPGGSTHYLVEAPHLPPYLRFSGTSPGPVSLSGDADVHDPKAGGAAILKVNNGIYTIRAKTYLSVGGQDYESAEVEFTVQVEPFPRSGLPGGMKYVNTAYYDPVTRRFHDFSFDVPQQRRRFTSPGWLVDAESTSSPDYWGDFVPDLTSNSSAAYAAYREPKVFSENSLSSYWGTETVVAYGRGWAAGDELHCDFDSVSSRKRYYGDSREGWISDSAGDVNDVWEEDLGQGWMTTDGFIPDQSTTIHTDDVYYDDERGRLTTSQPQGFDSDDDLGEGWIGGWMNRFIAEGFGRDTDRDLVPDGLEEALGLDVGFATSPPEDSDGDGLLDAEEVQQGSDPSNANDTWASPGSFKAVEEDIVPVLITFGDPSGSHSEQWQLDIYEVAASGSRTLERTVRADLGVLSSREIQYTSGHAYEMELSHVRGFGDYDYLFSVEFPEAGLVAGAALVEVDDADEILGSFDNISLESIEGTVKLNLVKRVLKSAQGDELFLNLGGGSRGPVSFEASPPTGSGSFVLTQSNDNIRVWSAETGGVQLTGPGSAATRRVEWDVDAAQLGPLNAANRVWVEGVAASDDPGDTKLTLVYNDPGGNLADEGVAVELTVLDVGFERFVPQLDPVPAGHIPEWVGRTPFDTSDYRGTHENTVLIEWSIPAAIAEEIVPDISFRVVDVNPAPIRTLESEVFIDDAQFRATDGAAPVRLIADFEAKSAICQDNNPEERTLTVGIFYQEEMLDFVDTIKILPRHRYLRERSYPEPERFDRAAVYNAKKYDLRFGYQPTYDPGMQGANGITETFLTPPFIRVFIGPAAAANENTLASTRIHENVHYNQGFTAIGEASAGHDFFFDWADITEFDDIDPTLLTSLDFDALSESEKASVQKWVSGEIDAYVDQLNADNMGTTCLPLDKRLQAEQSLQTYQSILLELI